MSADKSSNEQTTNSESDWTRTFEMFKLEYQQATQRYENIYKAIWQIFQYMAFLAGGILTFASKAGASSTEFTQFIVSVSLFPLVFWFFTTYIPMDQYGRNIREHLKELEKSINEKNPSYWEINHWSKTSDFRSPPWQVRQAVLFFGLIISIAWIFSVIIIFKTNYNNHNDLMITGRFILIAIFVTISVISIDNLSQTTQKRKS